jgi:hypothetical protein
MGCHSVLRLGIHRISKCDQGQNHDLERHSANQWKSGGRRRLPRTAWKRRQRTTRYRPLTTDGLPQRPTGGHHSRHIGNPSPCVGAATGPCSPCHWQTHWCDPLGHPDIHGEPTAIQDGVQDAVHALPWVPQRIWTVLLLTVPTCPIRCRCPLVRDLVSLPTPPRWRGSSSPLLPS